MSSGPVQGALDALLADPRVWRGSDGTDKPAALASGYPDLDRALGGGWPLGVVCELALSETGCGELSLLLPALCRLQGPIALIAPPHVPYPRAMAAAGVTSSRLLLIEGVDPLQAQWAAEQTLRSGACAAVLLWLPTIGTRAVRRLQLAAEAGNAFMVVLLPLAGSPAHSSAALRLRLSPVLRGVAVRVRKRRGAWPSSAPLIVEYPSGVVAGPGVAGTGAGGAADGG